MKLVATVSFVFVAIAAPARAAEVMPLPEVTVYGDRPPFSDLPQQTTIIHRDELLRSGALYLGQLLKSQASFAVREYGPVGALSSASLRGSLGEGVLVLRDGVKLNSPERGGVDLSTVSLVGVERVEILNGGASALYGAEAVGGVVNLVSAKKTYNRVQAGLGSFGHRYVQAESGATIGDTSLQVGVNRVYAQNDYDFAYRQQRAPRVNASFDGTDVALSGKTRLDRAFFDFGFNVVNHVKGVPGPANYPSPLASQHDGQVTGSVRWLQPWGEVMQTTALSHRHASLGYADPRSVYQQESTSVIDGTDFQSAVEWGNEAHTLTAGLGMTRDAVSGQTVGAKARYLGALFAHDEWQLDARWTAFGDMRLDYNAAFGWSPSPRLGVSWRVDRASRLRASLGRSYRAPTFNDLYWPARGDAAGNPDLRPERTLQLELGWDAQRGPWLLEGTLFANRGTDAIVWTPGAGGAWSPVNVGATDVKGAEVKATYALGPFRLVHSATGLSAIDLSGQVGKTLLYRPDWTAHSALSYAPSGPLSVSVGWDYLGKRFTTAQNTEFLAPVGLWSLGIAYALLDHDRLTVRVDNLADKPYELQPYYPMPGRQVLVSYAHDF